MVADPAGGRGPAQLLLDLDRWIADRRRSGRRLALRDRLIKRNGPCKSIDILNTGGSNLAITSVAITNDPTGSFRLCEDVPASPADPLILAPGASKPVSVRCRPATAAFQRIGFLTITSNDPDQPTRSVKLICRLENDP